VQEHLVPPAVPPTTAGNLADLPARNAARHPDRAALAKPVDGRWQDVTSAQFAADVDALAKGLIAVGLEPGQRVAIMSKTRYEWTLSDFAIWAAGGVVVPIYETSAPDQVRWIMADSECVGAIIETPRHAATVDEVRGELPALRSVWQIDAHELDELVTKGAEVSDETLEQRRHVADRTFVATIIYTSGTTGRPKGCELTHGNLRDLAENTTVRMAQIVSTEGASTVLFLPLAHVFARFIEILCIESGARLAHSSDLKNLLSDLASARPTFFLAVPRIFEKIYNSSEQKATAGGRGAIFATAAATAIAYSEALETGRITLPLRLKHAFFDKLVFAKIREAMGGRVLWAVSGGAPLGTRLGHYFRGVGVTILEGYGLTETTAPATVNTPELIKIGTVGAPLPGVGIRIADDGEILIKGNNVFRGYHNNPQASSAAFVEGWFCTGDIGELDSEGYLRITGRKKEILVTAGGKNVAPAVLEDTLRSHPLISQCIVVGDAKPFVAALLTLDADMWPGWAANHDLDGVSLQQAKTNPTVLAELQGAVDLANKGVSQAESIRKFAVLDGDFTEEEGYLTPSLKLRRNVVMRDFAEEVEALYAK
jgi:long-chain acyl-CoA synthetase